MKKPFTTHGAKRTVQKIGNFSRLLCLPHLGVKVERKRSMYIQEKFPPPFFFFTHNLSVP